MVVADSVNVIVSSVDGDFDNVVCGEDDIIGVSVPPTKVSVILVDIVTVGV